MRGSPCSIGRGQPTPHRQLVEVALFCGPAIRAGILSMSICLYLKHAGEIDQARYRRDGVAVADLQVGDDANDKFSLAELEAQERILTEREAAGRIDPHFASHHRAAKARVARRLAQKRGMAVEATPRVLDLHKSWHALHFAFTGRAEGGALPAAALLSGGTEVGRDLGYGRARIVAESPTRDFAAFLAGLDVVALAARLDPAAMRAQGVYGASRSRARLLDEFAYEFPRLRDHVTAAARGRLGLLVWMM